MKKPTSLNHAIGFTAVIGFALISCCLTFTSSLAANWENEITVYGWLADIDGKVQSPAGVEEDISYDASDILDNLEGVLMGGYEGRYEKFSFIADLVYMNVGDDADISIPSGTARADLDLESWLITAGVGYDVFQSEKGRTAVVIGLRYLDLEVDSSLSVNGMEISDSSGSQDLLDGLIGIRGYLVFKDNWFLPYYADIGTGDSDVSYQLFAGVGYRFSWGDIRLGYRYLDIDMDEKYMKDLTLSGPVLGLGFRF